MSDPSADKRIDAQPPDPPAGEDKQSLAAQGSVVAGMTMLSRISGLVRDILFAYLLGASQYADMFLVAFRIPNVFRRMFAEGAFNQAFVPVLMRFKSEGHDQMRGFLAPLLGLFSLTLLVFVALGLIFAEELVFLFAAGFRNNGDQLQMTADLLRITFPYIGFISLTAYAGAVLNAHNHFAVPAVTPVLLNLVLIGAASLALAGVTGLQAVVVLAWGVLLAGVVQLAFQVPSLGRLKAMVKPNLKYQHPGIGRVARLIGPALFSSSVAQINALVNTLLASMLISGSISWIYYADRLLELPVGLVAVALGTVMLPHLSRMDAVGDTALFNRTLGWGLNVGLMLGLPAAVALYLLAQGLIATIFLSVPGGQLTAHDARMAGYALEMFAVALPGFVLVRVLSAAFYAREDTMTPFRCAAVAVAANLIGSLATFSWFGHVGLAWATALSAWTNVFLLYFYLKRDAVFTLGASMWPLFWRCLLATGVLAASLWWVVGDWPWLAMSSGVRILHMAAVVICGVVLYLAVLGLAGVRPRDLNHYSAR